MTRAIQQARWMFAAASRCPQTILRSSVRRHGVRELALFGSVLRQDSQPQSDVDVLLEMFPDIRLKLVDLADMEDELERVFRRKVDLVFKDTLSRYIADALLRERQVLYVAWA